MAFDCNTQHLIWWETSLLSTLYTCFSPSGACWHQVKVRGTLSRLPVYCRFNGNQMRPVSTNSSYQLPSMVASGVIGVCLAATGLNFSVHKYPRIKSEAICLPDKESNQANKQLLSVFSSAGTATPVHHVHNVHYWFGSRFCFFPSVRYVWQLKLGWSRFLQQENDLKYKSKSASFWLKIRRLEACNGLVQVKTWTWLKSCGGTAFLIR